MASDILPFRREQQLRDYGFIYPAMLGLQPDLNPAWRKAGTTYQEASFCDHNCVRGEGLTPAAANGGYDCFAATDLNKGIVPTSMADFHTLRKWVDICLQGQRQAMWDYLEKGDFQTYCETHLIPTSIAKIYREALIETKHEINLFGGNPELNDAWIDLIPYLKECGHIVNLTTTGGRFQRDPSALAWLIGASRPDMLAVSADDVTPDEVRTYASMDPAEFHAVYKSIPRARGQDRKAMEGIWVARQPAETMPRVLFNTVIHERNVFEAEEMIATLREVFPHVLVNPYFAQSSMYEGKNLFEIHHLSAIEHLVDLAITDTLAGQPIPKRLPFYLYLKAIFVTFEDNPHVIPEYLAGYYGWQCYRKNACWYLQFGRSEQVFVEVRGFGQLQAKGAPGGHLGCTWNAKTITQDGRQIETPQQVRRFIRDLDQSVSQSPSCHGCTMPRLMYHAISIEQGMEPALWPAYHALRKQYVGF